MWFVVGRKNTQILSLLIYSNRFPGGKEMWINSISKESTEWTRLLQLSQNFGGQKSDFLKIKSASYVNHRESWSLNIPFWVIWAKQKGHYNGNWVEFKWWKPQNLVYIFLKHSVWTFLKGLLKRSRFSCLFCIDVEWLCIIRGIVCSRIYAPPSTNSPHVRCHVCLQRLVHVGLNSTAWTP